MNSPKFHSETLRLEIFSDAVFAIILTIMVLEIHVPDDVTWRALESLLPVFLSYVLSFVYLGIYWNNHHHLWHAAEVIGGRVMWANLHLLFWLSLIPFATRWAGENNGASLPAAVYGFILFMTAVAYAFLQRAIVRNEGEHSPLGKALRSKWKEILSIACYAVGIGAAFVHPWISYALFLLVALLWIVPDRRLETIFDHTQDVQHP